MKQQHRPNHISRAESNQLKWSLHYFLNKFSPSLIVQSTRWELMGPEGISDFSVGEMKRAWNRSWWTRNDTDRLYHWIWLWSRYWRIFLSEWFSQMSLPADVSPCSPWLSKALISSVCGDGISDFDFHPHQSEKNITEHTLDLKNSSHVLFSRSSDLHPDLPGVLRHSVKLRSIPQDTPPPNQCKILPHLDVNLSSKWEFWEECNTYLGFISSPRVWEKCANDVIAHAWGWVS
jgi:hypothetical protein